MEVTISEKDDFTDEGRHFKKKPLWTWKATEEIQVQTFEHRWACVEGEESQTFKDIKMGLGLSLNGCSSKP